MEMQTLTAPLLRELIDHIDVYETEGTRKNRTQRIMIHYKFVGVIETRYGAGDRTRFASFFPSAGKKDIGSNQFLNRLQQVSTGHLH